MTLLGQFALWIAFLLGLWATLSPSPGRWQDRPDLAASVTIASYGIFGALLVASVSLWKGLASHDFNIEYVAAYTSRNLPDGYIFSAFWAGQKGSLLFWAVVLSLFAAVAQLLTPRRYAPLMPYVAGVTSAVIAFFVCTMLFAANPFERLAFTPADGRGLNPQLQNPGMMIHPPMLYLGYISITIPFAFAIAALLTRGLDTGWIHAIRKWTLVSWLFLSIGITLGMWWAYVELGWGGYWAWDPVENASLLPWLTMTAFLHSVMIQEKRGMLKRWNVGLIIGTFLLSIFGTFITRSGVIASVHSFTQCNVGYFFLGFLVVAGVLSYTLLHTRWPLLKADVQLESVLSREAAFLFNNLLLVGIAFSVLWGTLFPILSELVRGTKITVGPPFFNRVNVPLGLLLLGLTGNRPADCVAQSLGGQSEASVHRTGSHGGGGSRWAARARRAGLPRARGPYPCRLRGRNDRRRSSIAACVPACGCTGSRSRSRSPGWSGRNRRRYGGYIVHVGVLIYFVAFAGMAFKRETEATLKPGESVELASPFGHTYRLTHIGISQFETLNRIVSAATVSVEKDGKSVGLMTSEKRQHVDSFKRPTFEPSTEVGIRSTLQEDLYLIFAGAVGGTEEAVYRFTINPLVWWVWFGGFVLALGGIVTMWPGGGPTLAQATRRGAGGLRGDAGRGGEGVIPMDGSGGSGGVDRRQFFLPTRRGRAPAPGRCAGLPRWPGRSRQPARPQGRRPAARPHRRPAIRTREIQAIEQRLACSCGCTLDVFTCRTTDFTCTYSPELHREVVALHQAGKDGAGDPGCLCRQVRREGADGAQARGLQPGGLLAAWRRHRCRRRRAVRADLAAAVVRHRCNTDAAEPVPRRYHCNARGARAAPARAVRGRGLMVFEAAAAVLVGAAALWLVLRPIFVPAQAQRRGVRAGGPGGDAQRRGADGAQGDRVRPRDR